MSQVDEGLIHAWLDGQLPPDEAARVERLVATDPEWQAAAAVARGMIAGASRILGALDDVPSVRSAGGSDPGRTSARRNARSWRSASWLRVAASVVLVAGVAGVTWWKFPAEEPMHMPAQSAEVLAPAVVAEPPVAAPAPVVAPKQRAESREAASAKSGARADQSRTTIGAVGGVAAAGVANAVISSQPLPVAEKGVMGVASTGLASQVDVDPRLSGCWVPLDSVALAANRANDLRDRDVFVLRFVPPMVTDVVRSAVPFAAPPGAARLLPSVAPSGARVQNAMSRKVNDSTFVTEWLRGDERTQVTFTVRGDTLRGTAVPGGKGAALPSQAFTAVRVVCPP